MQRRSRAGAKPVKTRRRKTVTLKRGIAPKVVRHRTSSNARQETEIGRLTRERDEALEQQAATAEVLSVINSSPSDLTPVFEAILEKAHSLCEVAYGSLQIYDGEEFRAVAARGISDQFAERLRAGFRPNAANPARGLINGERLVHIADIGSVDDPVAKAAAEIAGMRTVLFVPLRKDKVLLGQIVSARAEVRPFSENEVALLENFAQQAVIAIENARLLNELRQSLEQQTATSEVLRVISSSPGDLQPVFTSIMANATRICEANFGVLVLYENAAFDVAAAHNAPPAFVELRQRQPTIRASGALGRVVAGKRLVHISDCLEDASYKRGDADFVRFVDLCRVRSLILAPMLKENDLIGVIGIYRTEVRPFSDKQIELVQNFAAQAVIAIENARLLTELRQRTDDLTVSLEQQTATSEVLSVISRSKFDLKPILQSVVDTAARLCRANQAVIFRLEGGAYRFAAGYSIVPAYLEIERQTPISPGPGTLVGRAAMSRQVARIEDAWTDPLYEKKEDAKIGGHRSMIGVPLMREGEPVGVIGLSRSRVDPFSEREIELVTTFADQAVIAIENVRLFENVEARTRELAKSLEDLQNAQDRLVQTEKLASLGQLTAGIAHEIKNPLNFVNNFSAVSVELIDGLREMLGGALLDDKLRTEVNDIANMLQGNLEKVVQHGKRADSIVKNMLLHSRQGSGEHRPVDINSLVEESLNLAYHGARAEKQGFNITLERSFDPAAGEVDLFPQEITRVLLNLISNGFYAATKRKAEANGDNYEPTLATTTKNLGDSVEIRIRDNGTGIPPEVKERMFNPFFTTKPAGEGTGLGLSLSYDIIVKQHAGSIEVDTQPGEFTEFRLVLPRGAATIAKSGERN
jgi:two-component system, NtrC family, sensor kinase